MHAYAYSVCYIRVVYNCIQLATSKYYMGLKRIKYPVYFVIALCLPLFPVGDYFWKGVQYWHGALQNTRVFTVVRAYEIHKNTSVYRAVPVLV